MEESIKAKRNRNIGIYIAIAAIMLAIITSVSLSLVQRSDKYSLDNMMPGKIGTAYMFGDAAQRTSVIVDKVYKVNTPFEYNKTHYKNAIIIDMDIPYDNNTDYNYYLFDQNNEVNYALYDSDSKRVSGFNLTYVRNKSNGMLRVILEKNTDLSNIKWVRIFGLNTDKMNYDKTSLCFTIEQ